MSARGAFLTEPPVAKAVDRGSRTLAYLSLAMFAVTQWCRPRWFFVDADFVVAWGVALCVALFVVSGLAAMATLHGKAQAEYVLLPLILGATGGLIILGLDGIGFGPHVSILTALWSLLVARYTWLTAAVRRARVLTRLSKGE